MNEETAINIENELHALNLNIQELIKVIKDKDKSPKAEEYKTPEPLEAFEFELL